MDQPTRYKIAKDRGFRYNPTTGELIGVRGNVIKNKNVHGYIQLLIQVEGKNYSLKGHKLAWYLYYGELPKNNIDHIDGDKSNNRIDNLRDVTVQQNNWNRSNTKGYVYHKRDKSYMASICVNSKIKHLGYFKTEEEAREAYLEAKSKHHVICK
jgi:hypothetical protein